MKRTLFFFLIGVLTTALPVSSADPEAAKLTAKLKPLEQFIGEWDAVLKNESGQEFKVKGIIDPCSVGEGGAHGVTARFIMPQGSRHGFQFRIWYFDPESNRLCAILISENGGSAKFVATKESAGKSDITSIVTFAEADGSRGTAVEQLKWTDKDHFTLQSTENVVDGKTQASYRIEFTRTKKQ